MPSHNRPKGAKKTKIEDQTHFTRREIRLARALQKAAHNVMSRSGVLVYGWSELPMITRIASIAAARAVLKEAGKEYESDERLEKI